MPVPTDYLARETLSNLSRNRLMTMAAVLTVSVSLALVGAALMLKQGAAEASFQWERGTQVKVWMQPTATASQVRAVGRELRGDPSVQSCIYRDHLWSYNEAKKLDPYVIQQSGLQPAAVPTSWRCTPTHPQEVSALIKRYSGRPGVRNVTAPLAAIHTMETWIEWLKWVFVVVAAVMLVSATVLILNSIRMAIYARRREISVMKLVGATNWFIRVPFMSEGFVQGLAGAGLASCAVYAIHVLMDHLGNPGGVITYLRLSGWQVLATDAVLLVVGAVIGTLGSAFAIRRFLDV